MTKNIVKSRKGLNFQLFLTETEIHREVLRVGREIAAEYQGRRPLFIAILNGSFV